MNSYSFGFRYFLLIVINLCLYLVYGNHQIQTQFSKYLLNIEPSSISNSSSSISSSILSSSTTKILWPLPKHFRNDPTNKQSLFISPCQINYQIQATQKEKIQVIIDIYLHQVFKCSSSTLTNFKTEITLEIQVKNIDQMIAKKTFHQRYSLNLNKKQKWTLQVDFYVGFLRGIQTLYQLFQKKDKFYQIKFIPIQVIDQPDFVWRGLMIDSSRHFLPVQTIKKTIDALMFNKMNILHWHITDQDSFPMQVKSRPELSKHGSFGKVYTFQDIRAIIQYAKIRGVRVIPQIDTPSHTQSWGRSQKLKSIIVKCDATYVGQFNPTLDLTYEVVEDVMRYVNSTFDDQIVHFGGDQINQKCYQNQKQIKQWMRKHNIPSIKYLQIYYRQRQKRIWKSFTKKRVIYWVDQNLDLPLQAQDIIHWWGDSFNLHTVLKGLKNQVILSHYDLTYLDVGFGNLVGISKKVIKGWRNMYSFKPNIKDVNVIGGQVCMWSQISNQHTIEQKVWIRGSVIAQKLWNDEVLQQTTFVNIMQRLIYHAQRMKQRGYKVSVVADGICQKDISECQF